MHCTLYNYDNNYALIAHFIHTISSTPYHPHLNISSTQIRNYRKVIQHYNYNYTYPATYPAWIAIQHESLSTFGIVQRWDRDWCGFIFLCYDCYDCYDCCWENLVQTSFKPEVDRDRDRVVIDIAWDRVFYEIYRTRAKPRGPCILHKDFSCHMYFISRRPRVITCMTRL